MVFGRPDRFNPEMWDAVYKLDTLRKGSPDFSGFSILEGLVLYECPSCKKNHRFRLLDQNFEHEIPRSLNYNLMNFLRHDFKEDPIEYNIKIHCPENNKDTLMSIITGYGASVFLKELDDEEIRIDNTVTEIRSY